MCGIAGGYNTDGSPADAEIITAMTRLQRHRGPDDEGIWSEGEVAFGHRRLSILDLSEAGRQPMVSADGSCVITFNGEIYNYLELRQELTSEGHAFRTGTDTEVLLAAYREWGARCIERFVGMWAFGIWDRQDSKLFCSRDPFGIKPFFYAYRGETLHFASDIRALLHVPGVSSDPDWHFVMRQLTDSRYQRVEETSFRDIRALPPGCNLFASSNGIRIERHWNYSVAEARERYDYTAPSETFRSLLVDSLKLHFRSDVPVGVCLSGGLDSSSIVALASKELGAKLHTFSIVYPDTPWAEDRYVHEVNEAFHCRPTLATPPGRLDFLDTLSDMVRAHGEPDQGIGVYSQWKVMELAQSSVTVLLDGQGGDELLGGYRYFYPTYIGSLLRSGQLGNAWREYSAYRPFGRSDLKSSALKAAFPPINTLLRSLRGDVDRRHRLAAIEQDIRSLAEGPPSAGDLAAPPPGFDHPLSEHLYRTITSTLLQSLLYFEDRNSMAFSIEARVPFLDRRLVEFCLALPPDQLLRNGYTKWILREALRNDLPDSVAERRDKMGYPTPFAHWLRSGLMEAVREILLDSCTRGRHVFAMDVLEQRLREHEKGEADHSVDIFNWLTLELWMRAFRD